MRSSAEAGVSHVIKLVFIFGMIGPEHWSGDRMNVFFERCRTIMEWSRLGTVQRFKLSGETSGFLYSIETGLKVVLSGRRYKQLSERLLDRSADIKTDRQTRR